ncbi:MAG: dethiobiotin synthase [Plesiomonas sp.]|uniref:dethiobiotin synthase n=1 Tax=Plesiomonas sp. TaxID=2486279 RepID=UPI003EE780A6
MSKRFFVTGTDTEVGKTVVSRAFMQAAASMGHSIVGYKPIASGCTETEEGLRNSDALVLQSSASVAVPYELVNPIALREPISPHLAAKLDGIDIDFMHLSKGVTTLESQAELVLVEGCGGWRVPVTDKQSLSEWVVGEKMPVILVVGIKLGCLNHAILTAESIANDGVELVGWVANRVNPCLTHYAELIQTLRARMPAPQLGEIPYISRPEKQQLGKYMDLTPLLG